MYTCHYEYESENDKIVFETWQVRHVGIVVCECEKEGEARQIAELLNNQAKVKLALEECKHWHRGDPWRFSKDADHKGAWNRHMQLIEDAISE